MKSKVLRGLSAATQLYFRRSPIVKGKYWLWWHWVSPVLLRHELRFECLTTFGAKMRVTFPDFVQTQIYFFGIWEPGITDYIKAALSPGDTFIDIGANFGYYSLLASRSVGPEGRVFAFEASPTIFGELTRNLDANQAANVTARNVAVSDALGHVSIFLGDELGHSTIISTQAERQGAHVEADVESYPLSELVDAEAIARARIIKIDVEGAEWLVAQGMRQMLGELPLTAEILIEISTDATRDLGGSPSDLLALFAAAGYSAFQIDNHYTVSFYADRRGPRVVPYDGAPFEQKDFVLRRVQD